jgi:hypothetical protein
MINRKKASFVSILMLFSAGLLISLFQNCGKSVGNLDPNKRRAPLDNLSDMNDHSLNSSTDLSLKGDP